MSISGQIREEASQQADAMAFEIMKAASKDLTSSRFLRLRKGKTLPQSDREERYMYALRMYVHMKLELRRYSMFYQNGRPIVVDWSRKEFYEKEKNKYRSDMDVIEYYE